MKRGDLRETDYDFLALKAAGQGWILTPMQGTVGVTSDQEL